MKTQKNDFILEVCDLRKSFVINFFKKREVLKGLNFGIKEGKITGFLGPNGAGKTTTLRIILGFLKPDRGKIIIGGEEVRGKYRKIKLGYLPENPTLYSYLTPYEILSIAGKLKGLKEKFLKNRIEEISNKFQISRYIYQRINTLSKGMLQRVAFCLALLDDPELLFFDEPFIGLDPIGMEEIRRYILSLKAKNKTIFISSHLLSEMENICDDIIFINKGRIVGFFNIQKLKESFRGKILTLEKIFLKLIKESEY